MENKNKIKIFFKIVSNVLFFVFVFCCSAVLIFNFVFEYHEVIGKSMAPTLNAEATSNEQSLDGVFIRKNAKIKTGDIIVAYNPITKKHVIKRLVGLDGDKIAIEKTSHGTQDAYRIILWKYGTSEPVLFKLNNQEYIESSALYTDFYTENTNKSFEYINGLKFLVVPQNYLFYLGDNQSTSSSSGDSADYGCNENIYYIGKVEYIIYGKTNFVWQILKQTFGRLYGK